MSAAQAFRLTRPVRNLAARPRVLPFDPYRLRELPNEDIYFYRKLIDNSRVVRVADPASRARAWKFLGMALLAAAALIGLLLPSAYHLLSSYQISALQDEHHRLMEEKLRLEIREAELLSPQRLEELARQQGFVAPAPAQTVHLQDSGAQKFASTTPKPTASHD
jgi:hypothetical protein